MEKKHIPMLIGAAVFSLSVGTAGWAQTGGTLPSQSSRDAEGGKPMPRTESGSTTDRTSPAGQIPRSQVEKPGETERDAEGGRPMPRTGRSSTTDRTSPAGQIPRSQVEKPGETERDAEGGRPMPRSDSMRQGERMGQGQGMGQGHMGQGHMSNRTDVRAAQEALKNQGFDPGEIDGIMGPRTRQALRSYQQQNNLKQTGMLDEETKSKLGVNASASPASTR